MQKRVVIIGGGIGGLGTACLLAHDGYDVTLLEKNEQLGGKAGLFKAKGFTFDTGPSWYLMPEVFERFFDQVHEKVADHLHLEKLSPHYRVFFKDQESVDILGNVKKDAETFEAIETGAGLQLQRYLERSGYIYDTAIKHFLYKNYSSLTDFFSPRMLLEAAKLNMLSNLDRHARKYFTDQRLQQIVEYPAVFLGASPYNTPAFYSLLSHVDFNEGVYYPRGGMYELPKALVRIAKKHGVKMHINSEVRRIVVDRGKAHGVELKSGKKYSAEIIISNADRHHTEQKLLPAVYRDHSKEYWESRTPAPSALLIYLGLDRSYPSLSHHNLVFSDSWQQNFKDIFEEPRWPDDPSFYVCTPSKTDRSVAPKGCENLFVLVPLPTEKPYISKQLEAYADTILSIMEERMDLPGLRTHITYKKLFGAKDFKEHYNSYKGTGLGLSHTIKQTAVFRPKNLSKKVRNLYFVGADTHPGIGLPMVLISAELVHNRITSKS